MTTSYTGRGFDSIVNYIDSNGINSSINGWMIRITGEKIAPVNFSIINDELILTVDGVEYPNISEAVRQLAINEARGSATGSNEDGNAGNNLIGNYAFLRHVVFGSTTLEQIIGQSERPFNRKLTNKRDITRLTSVKMSRVLAQSARNGVFQIYGESKGFEIIRSIANKFMFDSKRMSSLLDTLNTNEFQLMFGRSESNFDLAVYEA